MTAFFVIMGILAPFWLIAFFGHVYIILIERKEKRALEIHKEDN